MTATTPVVPACGVCGDTDLACSCNTCLYCRQALAEGEVGECAACRHTRDRAERLKRRHQSAFDPVALIEERLATRGSKQGRRIPNDGHMWQCPAHEDKTPSLAVSRCTTKHEGAAAIFCHACSTGNKKLDAARILAPLGLSPRDLFARDNRYVQQQRPPVCGDTDVSSSPNVPVIKLLEQHRDGLLEPVDLGIEIPTHAPADAKALAEDLALLLGLRAAVGDTRPLPYATKWACARLNWGERPARASRALKWLCDNGVIHHAENLPPKSGVRDGTKCYLAGPLRAAPSVARIGDAQSADPGTELRITRSVEREPVGVEGVSGEAAEPVVEIPQKPVMHGAVPAGDDDLRVVTVGGGAHHAADDSAGGGRWDR